MQFSVDPEIFARLHGMRLAVVVARGVDNRAGRPGVDEAWSSAWAAAAGSAAPYGNAQSHPRVLAWRQRLQAIGVSMRHFPTSIEALLRRAMKGGTPFRINPLVDFYNAVSLRHTVPVGGFDLDRVPEPLAVRLTREGDTFSALDLGPGNAVDGTARRARDHARVGGRHHVDCARSPRTGQSWRLPPSGAPVKPSKKDTEG